MTNTKIETQAINTNGLWYAYVSINNKTVYSGKEGHTERSEAVEEGKVWLEGTFIEEKVS